MTIKNQHGGPCRNSKAVFEGGKFCLSNVIEVKATEVGILIVLETFCGLKLTCMGIFARDHRVKVTIKFQSKAQQESVKRSNINNGKILRNSPTSSYWPRSKKEKKKNKVTAIFFKARPLNGASSFFLIRILGAVEKYFPEQE